MITAEFLRECFEYEPETGSLFWKERPLRHFADSRAMSAWNYRYAGGEAGTLDSHGYRQCHLAGKIIKVHTICWAIVKGRLPKGDIDHVDRNRLNNASRNLRECSRAENSRNTVRKNVTGMKGVRKSGSRFTAQICVNYKKIHLGSFETAQEAHEAYCKAATLHHGEFANHASIEGAEA